MKVLLINGSPRQNGNTHVALKEIAQQLSKNGIDSEIFWIGNKPIRGCIGCAKCKQNGNGICIFDDDICNVAISKVNESDAIIVGSPVYYGTPTGPILSLIHRMLFAGARVQGKPAAAVAVCRRGGATAAFQCLQMPFQMMNMPIVTSQYWNVAYGRAEGEASQDIEGMQTMRTLANNMSWFLKKLATGDGNFPEREPWTPMGFIR